MMVKRGLLFTGLCLLLISCSPEDAPEEVVKNSDNEIEEGDVSIVPSYQLSEKNYKMSLPLKPSEARGVIVDQIDNRLDIDEMEEGLRRHSTEYFDPDNHYFEEGQYLDKDTVKSWLQRKKTEKQLEKAVEEEVKRREEAEMTVNDQVIEQIEEDFQIGLNPPIKDTEDLSEKEKKKVYEESPRYVSHILEQNFIERVDDETGELAGVSLGIAMKSVYRYQTEVGGPDLYKEISEKEMLKKGKEVAQTVLERVRTMEGLEDIPIMIALYREEAHTSPVPGNYVAKTFVDSGSEIDEWETIDEEHVLFPSDHAEDMYFDTHDVLEAFGEEIANYFPNYVGYIGQGFYIDEELKRLTIEIPIEFHGSSEVVGFTQYTYGLIKNSFTGDYDFEVKITSNQDIESVIYREAEDEPEVHIFH